MSGAAAAAADTTAAEPRIPAVMPVVPQHEVKQVAHQMAAATTARKEHKTRSELVTIYVLECQDECFYIGRTHSSAQDRFEQHKIGQGAAFTRLHPPIRIHTTFAGDKWDEDACVLRYMELYGIDFVRGGCYAQCSLSQLLKDDITRRFTAARDHCFLCDEFGHFARDCPRASASASATSVHGTAPLRFRDQKQACWRCGRKGHYSPACTAREDVLGRNLV